jgi:RNA polymerase sigma-70 factor (ECF subfamily)
MNATHPDIDLAARAASGDNAAWREIYTSTRDRVFALLSYHIGNHDEALDVLQDTYTAAVRGIERYHGGGSLESWICGIALRRARDWKRRFLRRFKQTEALEDQPERNPSEVHPQPDPELGHRLRTALAELPEKQRGALLLHEYMGFPFKDVAVALGVSEATARVHCFRAREATRARLVASPASAESTAMQEQQS